MRILSPALALGAILVSGLSTSSLLAQEQQQPAATTTQSSQSPAPHATNPQREAKKMTKKLGLTPDQESKIEPILADRQQQVQSAESDSTLAQKDKRAKVRSIRQDGDAKIEAIMTDTQKQQYEQMKQSHKEAKQQQGGAPTNN